MLAVYGKLKKFVSKAYDRMELLELDNDALLSGWENGELSGATAIAMLGVEYAAVGATATRIRRALDALSVPVVIIAETEALLGTRKPNRLGISVVVEKSKKPDLLRSLIDKEIQLLSEDDSTLESVPTQDVDSIDNAVIAAPMPELDDISSVQMPFVAQSLTDQQQISVCETTVPTEQVRTVELAPPPPKVMVKRETVETVVSVPMPLYGWALSTIPKYSPIKFDRPDEVIDHLAGKWGLGGLT